MSFSRRGRPLAEEEKSTDAAKARARAMELLAGQELSSGQLYERLGRKFTQPTAAAVVAEMVERQYVDDERYARTRAHGLLAARKSPCLFRRRLPTPLPSDGKRHGNHGHYAGVHLLWPG